MHKNHDSLSLSLGEFNLGIIIDAFSDAENGVWVNLFLIFKDLLHLVVVGEATSERKLSSTALLCGSYITLKKPH